VQISPRLRPVWALALIAISVSTLTRIVLLYNSRDLLELNLNSVFQVFGRGLVFDLASTCFLVIPLVLYLGFMHEEIYSPTLRKIILSALLVLTFMLACTNLIPVEFNKEIHWAVAIYVLLRLVIYFFLGKKTQAFRNKWRLAIIYADLFLFTVLILFNAMGEYFFWNEFNTRYNFIAVDYLVYTNEVLGNIRESYPVGPILLAISLLAAGMVWILRRYVRSALNTPFPWNRTMAQAIALLFLPVLAFVLTNSSMKKIGQNPNVNELSGNGFYDFAYAFRHNELDFEQFYDTILIRDAFAQTRLSISQNQKTFDQQHPFSVLHHVSDPLPEQHLNVVLISVESLSASFMGVMGNPQHLTPNLDTLAAHSLFFSEAYATGTRTVRGLEAISLSIPPPPGQSVVKRPNNKGLHTLGSLFKSKGYISQYLYGGYSYFDNMKDFFGGNGYEVIDRSAIPEENIHYENIWGVADEDLFNLAIQTLDSIHQTGKPFFTHIMTVSNHRPYTYPENRIDIPPSSHKREGAVKYTDYAIGKFLREAAAKPWFNNTIFVVVADHCASASGKSELPVTGYHIPMMIYAPSLLVPQKIDRLVSQIDLAPMLLGLMHFNYDSYFYGRNLFTEPAQSDRALISTYEGLGYLADSTLIVQSPLRKTKAFRPDFKSGKSTPIPLQDSIVRIARSVYQTSNWLMKHHHTAP
jgi:phosphoglycerol transferase MdoB-like AlkP superfamily enzyme